MRNYSVLKMDRRFLDAEWPKIEQFLSDGLQYSEGELDVSQLRMLCANGQADLYAIFNNDALAGCFAIEGLQYPNYRVANVISAGGKMICNVDFWAEMHKWLKAQGFSKVQCYCRPSVARMINRIDGFRTAYQLVRCDL